MNRKFTTHGLKYTLTFIEHVERFPGDKLAHDRYQLADCEGVVATFSDLAFHPRFSASLAPLRRRHWALMLQCRACYGCDRTPQGDGSLKSAVDDALIQIRIAEEWAFQQPNTTGKESA